ncbi:MAG TPA: hypothetical protein VGZ22_14505 [Isosphaeraceae bacterium]|jgi:hypothetical protein|nr:hypothetical protein [Isosphaeraceae bacterium]
MMMNDGRAATRQRRLVGLGFAACLYALISPAAMGTEPARRKDTPTFTKNVAPILQKRCQTCHHRDRVGPFPLVTYEQARKRASDIAGVVEDRLMPPWKPAAGFGPKLKHDRSLTHEEVAVLKAWADAGAPEGDQKHMPPTPQLAEGWLLGTPDLVLEPSEDFSVPASGPDIYRCFVIPTNLPKDTYISAIEYRPGNRRVVHHMMGFIDTSGMARKRDEAEQGPGYTSYSGPGVEIFGDLGGWAAGNEASHLPEGVGRSLPRQADVILQIHYHPSGKAEVDRTRLGIHFARGPIKQTLHWNSASSLDFLLPAGESRIEVKATWYVPVDVEALAVTPHMHLLGHDMRMTVTYPDGKTHDLIDIPDWDPSWQNTYYFEKPISLPKGSVVKVVAHFDNSSHPRNPNQPPKLVKYGPEASDEMCIGYIGVVKKGQDLTRPGEKDDLFEIFIKQRQKRSQREQLARERR